VADFFFCYFGPRFKWACPIEATIKMPPEVTGGKSDENPLQGASLCTQKADSYSDGRMGFGAEIESLHRARQAQGPRPRTSQAIRPQRKPNDFVEAALLRRALLDV